MAFIRGRRAQVLSDAIAQLSTSALGDLPSVVHATLGNVGSYQLDSAYAAITDLAAVLNDPHAGPEQAEARRTSTLAILRGLEADED